MVEEEHGILTKNSQMFSLPHFYFKFESVNISTILTSKLKMCVHLWRIVSWLLLGIYISWVESSVNKQICLNYVLFLHRVLILIWEKHGNRRGYILSYVSASQVWLILISETTNAWAKQSTKLIRNIVLNHFNFSSWRIQHLKYLICHIYLFCDRLQPF